MTLVPPGGYTEGERFHPSAIGQKGENLMKPQELASLKKTARIVAILTLAMTVFALFSMLDVPELVAPGDPVAPDAPIPYEGRFRLYIVSDSMICLIEIVLVVMLYVLLKPVSETLSLVAAFARLAMTTIQGMNLLNRLLALQLLGGADYLSALGPDQLRALAMLFLNAHGSVVLIWGLFFALHLFVLGYLVYRSGYIPRILGVVLMVAGLCYLVQNWGTILFPAQQEILAVVGFLSIIELAFPVWLLIKGVRDPQPAMLETG
jgi:hypothetical protein